jgi:hypothetical protein
MAPHQLILDVVPGRGGMFSLDNGRERRFLTRSRVFPRTEFALLERRSDGPGRSSGSKIEPPLAF